MPDAVSRDAHDDGRRGFAETMRRVFSPAVVALVVVSVPFVVWGMWDATGDPGGDEPWGWAMVGGASVVTALGVLLAAFRPGPGAIWLAFGRILFLALAVAVVHAVTAAIVFEWPGFREAAAATAYDDGWHYWYSADEPNPWFAVLTAGAGIAMCAGLAALIGLMLPLMAFFRPLDVAGANAYPDVVDDPVKRRRVVVAVRCLVLLLVCVFLAPTAFVLEWHLVGWITTVIGVGLLVAVRLAQGGRNPAK